MTDRELLELAAKAAGYKIRNECFDPREDFCGFRIKGDGMEHSGRGPWNPLTDDGDALRLAVKLELNVWIGSGGTDAECDRPKVRHVRQVADGDPYAAARRAIVHAAAEIGRTMK